VCVYISCAPHDPSLCAVYSTALQYGTQTEKVRGDPFIQGDSGTRVFSVECVGLGEIMAAARRCKQRYTILY